MARTLKQQRGFTLIELMIVVAIIGILAAVAIPAFMEYMNKGKKSEADVQINRMGKAMKAYYVENSGFASSAAALDPAGSACAVAGTKIFPVGSWTGVNAGLNAMEFSVDDAHRFNYDYNSGGGTTATGSAVADLDCDQGTAAPAIAGASYTTVQVAGSLVGNQPALGFTRIGTDYGAARK